MSTPRIDSSKRYGPRTIIVDGKKREVNSRPLTPDAEADYEAFARGSMLRFNRDEGDERTDLVHSQDESSITPPSRPSTSDEEGSKEAPKSTDKDAEHVDKGRDTQQKSAVERSTLPQGQQTEPSAPSTKTKAMTFADEYGRDLVVDETIPRCSKGKLILKLIRAVMSDQALESLLDDQTLLAHLSLDQCEDRATRWAVIQALRPDLIHHCPAARYFDELTASAERLQLIHLKVDQMEFILDAEYVNRRALLEEFLHWNGAVNREWYKVCLPIKTEGNPSAPVDVMQSIEEEEEVEEVEGEVEPQKNPGPSDIPPPALDDNFNAHFAENPRQLSRSRPKSFRFQRQEDAGDSELNRATEQSHEDLNLNRQRASKADAKAEAMANEKAFWNVNKVTEDTPSSISQSCWTMEDGLFHKEERRRADSCVREDDNNSPGRPECPRSAAKRHTILLNEEREMQGVSQTDIRGGIVHLFEFVSSIGTNPPKDADAIQNHKRGSRDLSSEFHPMGTSRSSPRRKCLSLDSRDYRTKDQKHDESERGEDEDAMSE